VIFAHHIQIEIPDPEDDNTIYVSIYRSKGTYDPNEYNAYLTDYQFSAESSDPNERSQYRGKGKVSDRVNNQQHQAIDIVE
jgi:hypothetical protein